MAVEANKIVGACLRWGLLTLVLAPVVAGALWGVLWLQSHTPRWVYWQVGLVAAITGEVVYGITLVGSLVGVVVFWLAARRRATVDSARRGRVFLGLTVCGSSLLSLGLAEAATAVWRVLIPAREVLTPAGNLTADPRQALIDPPADLRATPLPKNFPDPPGDPAIDLVMLGESSAEGVPFNYWVSVSTILEWRMREILPGRPIRTHVLAASGQTLEKQYSQLEHLDHRPELFIVYCGHNEISARLPVSRAFQYYVDDREPAGWARMVMLVERLSPLCGLLREQAEKCRIAIPPPRHGYRDLIDSPVYTEVEFRQIQTDFRARLAAIVDYANGLGAVTVLLVPAGNDSGFEPNRSYLAPGTPRGDRERFRTAFWAARRTESGPVEASIRAFQKLVDEHPEFAEAHYRLARQLVRAGRYQEAYKHDIQARDQDGYPMRMPSSLRQAYFEVARTRKVILIDLQREFHLVGPHGLLDDDLFQDGMHPSLRGQIAIAQAVLRELRVAGALGWPAGREVVAIDPAECVEHFGLIPAAWAEIARWGIMFYDLTYPMRYDPTERLARRVRYAEVYEAIKAGAAPGSLGIPNLGVPAAVPLVNGLRLEGRRGKRSDDSAG